MAAATGITARQITNVGEDQLYEVVATATTTETILIPSNIPVTATSKVKVVSANNITDGTSLGPIVIAYDDATTTFTYTESGAADEEVRIEFRIVG